MSPDHAATDQIKVGQAPSLLAHLLKNASSTDRQSREALFLTFNIDVGFFETRLLGACRAAGAAVTVIADAHVYTLDPRSARAAGQSYVLGLAASPGAFHPKLTVLAGPERALIGIGSGNITISGWHRSDEIAAVISADTTSCPHLVADLAQWLEELPTAVSIGTVVTDGVHRTAAQLRHLVAASQVTDTGHTLVSSTRGPIIDQLPKGRVSKLKLYAPFHDPRGVALRAMCRALEPDALQVAVQPGVTVIDPPALMAVANDLGILLTFHHCDPEPYRHGKLLEALRHDGTSWNLTGSPNLTAAGLLSHVPSRGNCELGIVTDNSATLFPGLDQPVTPDQIPTVSRLSPDDPERSAASRSGPVLLAATLLQGEVLRLEFVRPLDRDVIVEVSDYDDLPERYSTVGTAPVGAAHHDLEAAGLNPGSRIRLRWVTDEIAQWGPDLPLVDPEKATQRLRPSRTGQANTDADPLDLFHDPKLASAWLLKMNELVTSAPRAPKPTSRPQTTGPETQDSSPHRTLDDPDSWATYTDEARLRLGSMMVDFALGGLPRLATPTSSTSSVPIWVDRLGEEDEQFDDEHSAEEQDATVSETQDSKRARQLAEHEKARYRRWLRDLTATTSSCQAIDRLARAGLVLLGTRMQIWDGIGGANGWFTLLVDAIKAIPGEDLPETLKPQAAALTAVALYRLDRVVGPDRHARDAVALGELASSSRELLKSAGRDGVVANTQSLRVGVDPPTEPTAVWDHLTALLDADPVRLALRELERSFPEHQITHLHDNVFRIDGDFPSPVKAGGEVLAQLDRTHVAAVIASNGSSSATLVKNRDRLTIIRTAGGPPTYTSYGLGPLRSIPGIAAGGEMAQRARLNLGPLQRLSPEAAEDLEAAGLADPSELV